MQTSALTTLNKERMELITMIQNLNDQIMRKALKQEELEVQLNLYRNDKQRKKFQIKKLNQNSSAVNPKESNKKIQKTMHDKEEVKNIEEKQQEESLKKELEQKSNDISSLSVKLAQKEKKNNELERKIKEINADFSVILINKTNFFVYWEFVLN